MSITWLTAPTGGLSEPFELYQTVEETWANDKLSAKVQLLCPWSQRYGILSNILTAQLEWPYLPGSSILAIDGSIKPFQGSKNTDDGSGNQYVDAVVSVNFELASKTQSGAVFQESLEPTAEFLTLPYQDFRWASITGDALKKEEAPGRLEIGCDYNVTWNRLSSIPAQALTLIGCVNNAPVVSQKLNLTFGAETLLFNPPKISRSIDPSNPSQSKYQMACKFTYRSSGWNQFWRAKTGSFARIYNVNGGGQPYNNFQLANFAGVVP